MAEFPIAVLASGRGSNLRALLEAEAAGRLGGAHVALVTTNRPDCEAAALARQAGRLVLAYERRDFTRRKYFDDALVGMSLHFQPALLVCAGFMHILGPAAVRLAQGRIINIHPSLLPRHPGLHTHERALGAGDAEHGATVHQVVPAVDAGPVIAQARVPVLPGDDVASLAARVLAREHPLLVAVVRAFAEGELTANPSGVAWRGNPLHAALSLDNTDCGLEEI